MASSDHSTNCVNTSDEDFSSDEESSSDSMETVKSAPGKLRPDELQILQDGLKDWKEADTNKRASLMEGMRNKIKWLDANKSLKQNEWNRKQTAIKNWMYNNSQSRAQKALVKYGSKWTALKVIKLQHKKDIQQVLVKAGIQPGTSAMIKHYQPAVQKVVQSLTKAELDQAAHLAKEWNERKPPPEAQAEATTSKGRKYAKQFAYDMWKQCGMRVVIMLAWKDKDGEYLPPNIPFKEPTRLTHHELIETLEFWKERQQEHPEDVFQFQRWRSQDGSLEEPVSKHQCQSDKAKGKRLWTEVNSVDGSNYGHHSEEEPAPPTKPSTKWQRIDDHPTGISNAQEDNRWWKQSTSDWHNTATAYPKPAELYQTIMPMMVSIQLQGSPSPSQESDPMHSTAAQNDKTVISPNDGVDLVGRNLNARPRGHAMDREDRLLDQAEEDGVARCPERNCRPPWRPDDNYPTPTMRRQR
ncbi:hypothetical protein BKA82DRAFT_4018845 [Pisolithus tinctorius]|nr:hypothetical protein BKA82DRAFT_4018845 [Pisolithus tinctorius]